MRCFCPSTRKEMGWWAKILLGNSCKKIREKVVGGKGEEKRKKNVLICPSHHPFPFLYIRNPLTKSPHNPTHKSPLKKQTK